MVLACHRDNHSQIYAVKVLQKAQLENLNKIDNAITERRINQLLSEKEGGVSSSYESPSNFVKLIKTFQNQTSLFFVMEYCSGGDLLSLYEDIGGLNEEATRFYAANIVLILEDLHRHGVIHRDIKSENFLISDDGYLKLADFGDSKDEMHQRGRTHSFCGTHKFMAPEVVQQSKDGYDFSYDWWGLGCMVYEMLCGDEPFTEMNSRLL